jgi:retron-type reverse transcriptase
MKRAKNLLQQISDLDNLYLAFYKAKKGKSQSIEMQDFQKKLDSNLQQMASDIKNECFEIGNYKYFMVKDPKERKICAASFRERVLHHAIMNICHESFENYQMFHSYATRPGKGTHSALQYAVACQHDSGWFIKLDVKKFFDTIDHNQLKYFLNKRFKEPQLLRLFFRIIDSYNNGIKIGLPIGNLTSQYFANYYMAQLDQYAKEILKIKKYVRYMDDIVFWNASKQQLLEHYECVKTFLHDNLKQVFKPTIVNRTNYRFSFLGYIVSQNGIVPNKASKKRYECKIVHLQNQLLFKNITENVASNLFWALHAFYNFRINNTNTHHPQKLEPCFARRQLEQQRPELPFG